MTCLVNANFPLHGINLLKFGYGIYSFVFSVLLSLIEFSFKNIVLTKLISCFVKSITNLRFKNFKFVINVNHGQSCLRIIWNVHLIVNFLHEVHATP
jgi:hypothetical protein